MDGLTNLGTTTLDSTIAIEAKDSGKSFDSSAFLRNANVVVVIPTLNEERMIGSVLSTLMEEQKTVPNLEIVVADGGSSDRTVEIARRIATEHSFVSVLDNRKRLQSAAVNLVAQAWRGKADFLIRCDAHSIYPESFVSRLITTLTDTGADSVVVPMDSVGRNCIEKAVAWVSDTPAGSGGSGHRGGAKSGFIDHGHHAAFRLDKFLSVGGYEETFSHNEDAEFDCRLNAMGGRIYLDASIRIGYHPRGSFSKLWRQYYNYGKGRSRTVRRHPHTVRVRQAVVPAHFLLSVASFALATITGWWLFVAWPVMYAAALTAVSIMIVAKKRSACGFLAGVAACIMHTAWACGFFKGLLFSREKRWSAIEIRQDAAGVEGLVE
jgi:succinoglycan biosynthesis protein ExoA